MFEGLDRFTAGWFENLLIPAWHPLVPHVLSKLENGARVADVGCGRGRAVIKLAQQFRESRFVGYDIHGPNVDRAIASVRAAGVSDMSSYATSRAAFAADGYARATGRPGVAITTAGPGATNTLTAIAEAWSDSSPVISIASPVASPYVDQERGFGHELCGQLDLFRTATRFQARPTTVGDVALSIGEAFAQPNVVARAGASFRFHMTCSTTRRTSRFRRRPSTYPRKRRT